MNVVKLLGECKYQLLVQEQLFQMLMVLACVHVLLQATTTTSQVPTT